jgi:hypothetical protein
VHGRGGEVGEQPYDREVNTQSGSGQRHDACSHAAWWLVAG